MDKFKHVPYPTPAMIVYNKVLSVAFARFYWAQEPSRRKVLSMAVTRELYHEGGGRVYKRLRGKKDVLVKLNFDEFHKVVLTRLLNDRYTVDELAEYRSVNYDFDTFTEGEKIMAQTLTSVIYNGTFQFHSIINRDYCYIKFDSRPHIMKWKTSLVNGIDLHRDSDRRVTRQMARLRNDAAPSVSATDDSVSAIDESNEGWLFEYFLATLGPVDENKTGLDEKWLKRQGVIPNSVAGYECSICLNAVQKDEEVFKITCDGHLKHPLHKKCARDLMNMMKVTSCPTCRASWS